MLLVALRLTRGYALDRPECSVAPTGPGPFSRVKRPSICPTVFRLNYLIGMS